MPEDDEAAEIDGALEDDSGSDEDEDEDAVSGGENDSSSQDGNLESELEGEQHSSEDQNGDEVDDSGLGSSIISNPGTSSLSLEERINRSNDFSIRGAATARPLHGAPQIKPSSFAEVPCLFVGGKIARGGLGRDPRLSFPRTETVRTQSFNPIANSTSHSSKTEAKEGRSRPFSNTFDSTFGEPSISTLAESMKRKSRPFGFDAEIDTQREQKSTTTTARTSRVSDPRVKAGDSKASGFPVLTPGRPPIKASTNPFANPFAERKRPITPCGISDENKTQQVQGFRPMIPQTSQPSRAQAKEDMRKTYGVTGFSPGDPSGKPCTGPFAENKRHRMSPFMLDDEESATGAALAYSNEEQNRQSGRRNKTLRKFENLDDEMFEFPTDSPLNKENGRRNKYPREFENLEDEMFDAPTVSPSSEEQCTVDPQRRLDKILNYSKSKPMDKSDNHAYTEEKMLDARTEKANAGRPAVGIDHALDAIINDDHPKPNGPSDDNGRGKRRTLATNMQQPTGTNRGKHRPPTGPTARTAGYIQRDGGRGGIGRMNPPLGPRRRGGGPPTGPALRRMDSIPHSGGNGGIVKGERGISGHRRGGGGIDLTMLSGRPSRNSGDSGDRFLSNTRNSGGDFGSSRAVYPDERIAAAHQREASKRNRNGGR